MTFRKSDGKVNVYGAIETNNSITASGAISSHGEVGANSIQISASSNPTLRFHRTIVNPSVGFELRMSDAGSLQFFSGSGGNWSNTDVNITSAGVFTAPDINSLADINCHGNCLVSGRIRTDSGTLLITDTSNRTHIEVGASTFRTMFKQDVGIDGMLNLFGRAIYFGHSNEPAIEYNSGSRVISYGSNASTSHHIFHTYHATNHRLVRPNTSNGTYLGGSSYRWITVFGVNAFNHSSDLTKKTDVEVISAEGGWEFVKRMNPIKYRWVDNQYGRLHHGFGAQEIKGIINEVGEDWGAYCEEEIKDEDGVGTGEMDYSIRPTEMIPVLTSVIKGLKTENEALRSENEAIKSRLNSIEEMLARNGIY